MRALGLLYFAQWIESYVYFYVYLSSLAWYFEEKNAAQWTLAGEEIESQDARLKVMKRFRVKALKGCKVRQDLWPRDLETRVMKNCA